MKKLIFLLLFIPALLAGQTVLLGDEQYGSELVINGDFAVSTGWTFNDDWSYDAVNLEADYTDGVQSYFDRSITITAGITYQVSYTIKNYSAGTGYIWFTNQTGSGLFSVSWWTITANGVFTANYVALESATSLKVYAHSLSVNYSVDDISIKAVTKEAGFVLTFEGKVLTYPAAPYGIDNLKSWYDFTDLNNLTKTTGDSITIINDKSVTANHGTASGTLRPLYVANQINGLGVGRFNHASSLNTLTTSSINYGANYTVFIVGSGAFFMNAVMGNAVGNSLLTHQYGWGVRTATSVLLGAQYYYSSFYAGAEHTTYTIRVDAGTATFWERENLRSYSYISGSSSGTLILKDIGGWAAYPYLKDIAEMIIYDRSLSIYEVERVQRYLTGKYALSSFVVNPTNRITFTGNSMTENPYYQNAVFTNLNTDNSWIPSRFAQGGWQVNSLYPIGAFSWLITQRTQSPVVGNDVVICWGGTNDIYAGEIPADVEARINTLCTYYKDAGFKVVVLTILPRTAAGSFTEAERLSTNTLIRANYAGYADAIADIGADALMGQEFDNENTTYYLDGIHPKEAGYDRLITEWIQPAINSVLE